MKKRISFIFIFFLLLFLPTLVKGASVSDTECRSYVEEKGYDEASDSYVFNYHVYMQNGLNEGTLSLPSNLYNNKRWFLRLSNNGLLEYAISPVETLYICGSYFYKSVSDSRSTNLTEYIFRGGNWEEGLMQDHSLNYHHPNSYLYLKNVNIIFAYKQNPAFCSSLLNMQDNSSLKCPKMSLLPSTAIRVDLNDFVGSTVITSVHETINSLSSIKLKVYDLNNNKNVVFSSDNVLSYSDVQQNLSTKEYYIDLKFSDYLTFLTNGDGDYLLEIVTSLNSQKHMVGFGDITYADFKTSYTATTYARYKHSVNSNTGVLIGSDSEGGEISGGGNEGGETGEDKDDKTAEAIKNQTNAINNQTQKIEEQTNAIKENTETNKNIFQQIIELPRQNYRIIT